MKYQNCLTYDQCIKKLETVTCDHERMRLADLCIYTDLNLAGEQYDHMCRISRESAERLRSRIIVDSAILMLQTRDQEETPKEGTFFELLFKTSQEKKGADK